ncbi:Methanol oxidation protein MoxJ [Granulibacter bethesdensis]|nr:Methanol oxidation protein MoxJ [Granulibacter bethesdensis]
MAEESMRTMRLAAGLIASLLVSAASPAPEPDGYRMQDFRAPTPATLKGAIVLDAEALHTVIERGRVVLIDAMVAPRKPKGSAPETPWMPPPRLDIPGSLWLADIGLGTLPPGVDTWFRHQLANATMGDKGKLLVFYCLPNCWMSWNAAKRALSYGYPHVAWFPGGTEAWKAAGYRLVPNQPVFPPEQP